MTMSHIVYKVLSILRTQQENSFQDKGFAARLAAETRFFAKYNFVYRTKTNEATKSPAEVYKEATAFMDRSCPSLHGPHRNKHWIWNMDQMPVYFSYHHSKTLAKRSIKTVHMRKTTLDTQRATCALMCMAAGDFLCPMLIYKGKAKGLIATRELKHHDPTLVYACQDAAWMDEVCMLRWVKEILKPYLAVNPPPLGIMPVILLDAYRCHMMASVINKITDLGIEIIHIPGGCTGLTQPLDVGINKPFKSRVRALWEEWTINEINRTGLVYAPTREDIFGWVVEVVWGMDGKDLMRNAWRKTGYNWFSNEVTADANDGGNGGVADDGDIGGDDGKDADDFDDVNVADMLKDILRGGDSGDESIDDDDDGML
jgi:hypothetical protein